RGGQHSEVPCDHLLEFSRLAVLADDLLGVPHAETSAASHALGSEQELLIRKALEIFPQYPFRQSLWLVPLLASHRHKILPESLGNFHSRQSGAPDPPEGA